MTEEWCHHGRGCWKSVEKFSSKKLNIVVKNPILEKFRGKIKILSGHNLLC